MRGVPLRLEIGPRDVKAGVFLGPRQAVTVDVTDAVDNGGTCTVTAGTGVSIPASGCGRQCFRSANLWHIPSRP
jgi:hypothetical protein